MQSYQENELEKTNVNFSNLSTLSKKLFGKKDFKFALIHFGFEGREVYSFKNFLQLVGAISPTPAKR